MQDRLFAKQDLVYRDFSAKLMPTVDADTVIGVRIPVLRKMAKDLYGTDEAAAFLCRLPHTYLCNENHRSGRWFQKALAMSRKNILLCIE